MDYELKGRTCLVTGASSGIGAGIVRLFSAQGASIVAVARRVGRIERLAGVTPVAADLTQSEELDRVAPLGPVEILVNCAGGSRPTTPDSSEDVWDEAFALNFTAVRKGLSCDIAADGVTLNAIQPGRIDSEQIREKLHPTEDSQRRFIERNIPIGYFGEPSDVAHLAAFLASPAARYITGSVIPVDGGMHYFAH